MEITEPTPTPEPETDFRTLGPARTALERLEATERFNRRLRLWGTTAALILSLALTTVIAIALFDERDERRQRDNVISKLNDLATKNQDLLEELRATADRIEEGNRAMMDQHDNNEHARFDILNPDAPPAATSRITVPPRTTTATTRPRTTATTRRPTPTTARPAPRPTTTSCERLPNGKCKKK